jgi:hypothetical protein
MATYRYWQHFLALEADFAAASRYVEFAQPNFKTYSTEFAKLLLAIGSEVDVLCKNICAKIDPAAKRGNIDDYRACIVSHNARITTEEALIRRYDLVFKPWDAWSRGQNPTWWRSYNNVKHERNTYSHEANLENCANAISGLFVVVLYCRKAEKSREDLDPLPILLGRDPEPTSRLMNTYIVPDFT